MLVNKKKIRVEWGDCDPAGIVYYPRYFALFDNCTAALFEAAGLPKQEMLKTYGIVGMPLHIEILYNEYQFVSAFAVASLLALLALVTLLVKTLIEWKARQQRTQLEAAAAAEGSL